MCKLHNQKQKKQVASRVFKHKWSLEIRTHHTSMTCSSSSDRDALISSHREDHKDSQGLHGASRMASRMTSQSDRHSPAKLISCSREMLRCCRCLCLFGSWPKSFQNLLNETEISTVRYVSHLYYFNLLHVLAQSYVTSCHFCKPGQLHQKRPNWSQAQSASPANVRVALPADPCVAADLPTTLCLGKDWAMGNLM